MGTEGWLEVSLLVDGEMAEAVSEVLARFVSGGVIIESTGIAKTSEGGWLTGLVRVYGYLAADAHIDEKRRSLEEALWYLGRIKQLPEAQYRPVQDLDWSQIWKEHFHPVPIGKQLIIIPSWLEFENSERISVRIDPGMAFGTGTHPSTQLCLQLLEESLGVRYSGGSYRDGNQLTMIDIGCGSGILSIAAAKLGVSYVLGVDKDNNAIEVAVKNAAANQVQNKVDFSTGSVREVGAGLFSIRNAPLVVANILSATLIRLLANGLGDLVAPGGKLILSGILAEQVFEVESSIRACGLRVEEERALEDWRALVAAKVDGQIEN